MTIIENKLQKVNLNKEHFFDKYPLISANVVFNQILILIKNKLPSYILTSPRKNNLST